MTLLVGESEATSPSALGALNSGANQVASKASSGAMVYYTSASAGTALTANLLCPSSGARAGTALNWSIGLFSNTGVLLAQSASFAIPSTYAGVQSASISYSIAASTQYGLGILADGSLFGCTLAGISDTFATGGTFPNFNSVTVTSGGTYYAATYPVMWIDGTVSGGSSPIQLINPYSSLAFLGRR